MGAALDGVDVVGEGEDVLAEAAVVLQRDLDDVALDSLVDVDRGDVDRTEALVEVLDERLDAALEVEDVLGLARTLLFALVQQPDGDALVEVGQLAEPVGDRVPVEVEGLEDLGVGVELDRRASLGGFALGHDRRHRLAALVLLVVDLAATVDPGLDLLGKRVDHGHADAVEATRDLVPPAAELATGVEHGEDHLEGRLLLLGHDVHGDATAVIGHGGTTVLMESYDNLVREAAHGLVDGVVDYLVEEVMQAPGIGRADVHPGPSPDCLKPLQDLDLLGVVRRAFTPVRRELGGSFSQSRLMPPSDLNFTRDKSENRVDLRP